jgi:hypothetical protein
MNQLTIKKSKSVPLMIIALMMIAACTKDNGQTSTESTLGQLSPLSVKEFWSQAFTIAREWREDSYMREVTVNIRLPNVPSSYSSVTFDFQSKNEEYVSLIISCKETGCKSSEFRQETGYPLIHCTPFDLDDFKLDSRDALEIGLEAGGSRFVHSNSADITLYLSYGSSICKDSLMWRVSFLNILSPSTDYFEIKLDPNTGEVIETRPQ